MCTLPVPGAYARRARAPRFQGGKKQKGTPYQEKTKATSKRPTNQTEHGVTAASSCLAAIAATATLPSLIRWLETN